nr:GHKL domain-containing protein [Solobacterium sp.]
LLYSGTIFILMWLFRKKEMHQPAENIVIFILLWNVITSAVTEMTVMISAVPFHFEMETLFNSEFYQYLFFPSRLVIAAFLYLIVRLSEKYKALSTKHPAYFVFLFLFLFVAMTSLENLFFEFTSAFKIIFSVNMILFVLAIMIYYLFIHSAYDHFEETQKTFLIHQMEMIENDRQMRDEEGRKLKTIRHDLKNQYMILKKYVDDQDYEQASSIIKKSLDDIDRISVFEYCSYPAVNAILTTKLSLAKQKGIRISYRITLENIRESTEYDIAMILANLLDNAVENISASDPKLYLSIKEADEIAIVLENSTDEKELSLKTKKEDSDNHGMGIRSIQHLAEKHRGSAVFDIENGMFRAVVTLNDNL